jgi:hypothetical protein
MAISGRMDASAFGPSVPTHHTEFMQGRGKRKSGPVDGDGRRSVYLSVDRNFISPFFLTFDMPSPFGPQGRRSRSNVPAQSLAMMNDPMIAVEASRWARNVLRDDTLSETEKLDRMFLQATGTAPNLSQRTRLISFLRDQASHYPGDATAKTEHAWTDLSHLILNLKAFVFLR